MAARGYEFYLLFEKVQILIKREKLILLAKFRILLGLLRRDCKLRQLYRLRTSRPFCE